MGIAVGAGGAQAAGGALDLSFGSGGIAVTDLNESMDTVNAVAVQRDGKIVAAGTSNAAEPNGQGHGFALVRYTTAGKLDTTFGRGGTVLTSLGHESEVAALALQRDGKIVAVGSSDCNTDGSCFALVRYTTTGRLDRSFGSGGEVLTSVREYPGLSGASAVALQADGKIVAAGTSTCNRDAMCFALVRYTTAGTLDRSFGTGGKVLTDLGTGSDDEVSGVAIQKDGKIVVAGTRYAGKAGDRDDFALVRYTSSGRLDTTFGRGGKVLTDVGAPGGGTIASAVAIQRDGKIVAAGTGKASFFGDPSDVILVRYTTGGKLDASFGLAGKVRSDFAERERATAVAIQEDRKIVVAVESESSDDFEHDDYFELVRYTAVGRLDNGFGAGGKVLTDFGGHAWASAVALQKDGKILAAGSAEGASWDFAVVRYTP